VTGALTCPFCDSPAVQRIGQWGGQMITAQWRCADCNSYFEAVREDFGRRESSPEPDAPAAASSDAK
jgi:transposase-like protein